MAAADSAARIDREMVLRKNPMPRPAPARARALARIGEGKLHARDVARPIAKKDFASARKLAPQRLHERLRNHSHAVLAALALPHDDLFTRQIDILHTKSEALRDAHAGAVHEARHQGMDAVELGEDRP